MLRIKLIPAALCSIGALTVALPAHADQLSDLQAQLQKLSAEVQQLKAQQAQAAKQAAATQKMVAAKAPSTAPVWNPNDPLRLGGKDNFVKLYGDIDEFGAYLHSSSGANLTSLYDGALLRSRLGLTGGRAIAPDYAMNFDLEQSLDFRNGGNPGAGRLFDRQAWAGVQTPVGEFRIGRQETIAFFDGGKIDFTSRTLGSVVNAFGVPSRFDRDISYSSPRIAGLHLQAHYALSSANGSTVGSNGAVYQLGADYTSGPIDVGYNGLWANAPSGATYKTKAEYQNLYADYNYGRGKVYLTYVRSNVGPNSGFNNIGGVYSTATGVTTPLTGTNAGINNYYNIYQLSADYDVTEALRVGALYGQIRGSTNSNVGAKGWAAGAYYTGYKSTILYALVNGLSNDSGGGFTEAGSSGPLTSPGFSAVDLTGKRITGVEAGFVYKF